jgi:hypothetical protein
MFDAKAAFLNAELEKPMYVEWPEELWSWGRKRNWKSTVSSWTGQCMET